MRVVLDECVHHGLRPLLIGHDVFTVRYLGWSGVKNGQLLRKCGANHFDALVTTDRKMPSQQNLHDLPVALILLDVHGDSLEVLRKLLSKLLTVLATRPEKCFIKIASD